MRYALENLNPQQQKAVEACDKEVLVIAGAGSGKTKVLINRIAYLLQNGVSINEIMAVTFTNKAAKEMTLRLGNLVNMNLRNLWIGTFHGICNRFLRIHYERAGLNKDFQILDPSEQAKIVKSLLAQYGLTGNEKYTPKRILNFISSVKESASRNYAQNEFSFDKHLVNIAFDYDRECKKLNALDFDDLLLTTYEIFLEHEDLREHYRARFKHILIDEFQDTNTLQYSWLKLLHTPENSLFAVGDDDQSIYGFRGAQIGNIRDYANSYADTNVIRLEQNYRSTGNILEVANYLIKNNTDRLGKDLWTDSNDGEKIKVYAAINERDEAGFIGQSIKNYVDTGGDYKDVAVLYRSNAQSQALETNFKYMQIPYKIYGGLKFYSREEVRHALCYLRLVFNTKDDLAFDRVVNIPKRGVGVASLEKLAGKANELGLSLWEVAEQNIDGVLRGKALTGVQEFMNLINDLRIKLESEDLPKLTEAAIKDSGLLYLYEDSKDIKQKQKAENLGELINASADFCDFLKNENPALINSEILYEYLTQTTLETEELSDTQIASQVQMMTLHNSKGLEFPIVFICGMEEGLFPHDLAIKGNEVDEERRLCYVGVTRAREKLVLTYCESRVIFGDIRRNIVSRFVDEMPQSLLDRTRIKATQNYTYGNQNTSYSRPKANKVYRTRDFSENDQLNAKPIFQIGQSLRHKNLGEGVVMAIEGSGEKTRLIINFEFKGVKTLLAKVAFPEYFK